MTDLINAPGSECPCCGDLSKLLLAEVYVATGPGCDDDGGMG